MPSLSHHNITANGHNFHVVQAGNPDGKLVLMLHGFPQCWYMWRHQIQHLAAAGYQVWCPDQRGYNLSDKPKGAANYNLNALTEDMLGLLDVAGAERCYLVGHDWGGAVAWWFASRYPERVEKLALCNSPHHRAFGRALRTDWRQRLKSFYMLAFQIPILPEALWGLAGGKLAARLIFNQYPQAFPPDVQKKYREAWAQKGAKTAMLNWYRALFRDKIESPPLKTLPMPVLILWGEGDRVFKRNLAEASLKYCEDGRVEYQPEASHWIAEQTPDFVNESLSKFFA